MDDQPVSRYLPHAPLTAHHRSREHGLSERTNDVSQIVPTVTAWDQHFAMLASPSPGQFELDLAFDSDEVRQLYERRWGAEELLGSHPMKEVNALWYAVRDT